MYILQIFAYNLETERDCACYTMQFFLQLAMQFYSSMM